MSVRQTVDKTTEFRQFDESFGQAFPKACAVEAAEASSRSAEREIPLSAFSFGSFSLAPPNAKRKAAKEFVQNHKLGTFCLHSDSAKGGEICFLRDIGGHAKCSLCLFI